MTLNINQQLFCMLTALFITLLPTTNTQMDVLYDEALAQVTARPMPEDLLTMFKNKTGYDLDMEECMNEFVYCSTYLTRERPFCGANQNGVKRFFYSICEMVYENCKENTEYWHYLDDKLC